ncbi:MAG: hypothetical protein E6X34_10970 [Clostridium sp.]|uniref:hypothetical protein n=1 Tax=Clostridium sp. TaxID=1506 RepID=UPI00290773E5|nr:hypothetical protein [Clostridium sp.]MDU4938966.1 hypothetical protein [Clostridium sp.]
MITFVKKNKIFIFIAIIFIIILVFGHHGWRYKQIKLIAGGVLFQNEEFKQQDKEIINTTDYEKYFRPSKLPILNTSSEVEVLLNEYGGSDKKIVIPDNYLITPNNTIINYFSVLREAANVEMDKGAGCGTIGRWREPYRIAYEFFTKEYKEKVSYKAYEKSFLNILHINLIKFRIVNNTENEMKYFFEIETIQGSKENVANFVYYYGFIKLSNEDGVFKIKDISISPEEYLCAPYHGWSYDGKSKVEIEYGGWCKLVKEIYEVSTEGYVKNIYFKGTDNKDYRIEFYILTNDYDIEVSQYVKENGKWKSIKLDPDKCLKEG